MGNKMVKALVAILLVLLALIGLPVVLIFGAVLLPVILVIAAIVFIFVAIGIVIGSSGKGGQ